MNILCFTSFLVVLAMEVKLCTYLSMAGVAAQCVGDLGGVNDVINAMSQFPDHVAVQTTCCNALWSLTVNGKY